jgi:hypothetical protein
MKALRAIRRTIENQDPATTSTAEQECFRLANAAIIGIEPLTSGVMADEDQQLFVIKNSTGITTLGFEKCAEWTTALALWLDRPAMQPTQGVFGTDRGYQKYEAVLAAAKAHCKAAGDRCPVLLTPELLGKEGAVVEIYGKNGYQCRVTVNCSQGWMPIHIDNLGRSIDIDPVNGIDRVDVEKPSNQKVLGPENFGAATWSELASEVHHIQHKAKELAAEQRQEWTMRRDREDSQEIE